MKRTAPGPNRTARPVRRIPNAGRRKAKAAPDRSAPDRSAPDPDRGAAAGGYVFSERRAAIATRFFERLLRHTKGEYAGKPFILAPWERKIIRDVFGWIRPDGTRRYRTVYVEVPRKNGKSTLAAGIALLLLFADGESSAEIYSAAADRDQASLVFNQAKDMFDNAEELTLRGKAFKRVIVTNDSPQGIYRVISSDAPTKHGLNASGIIFDELHAQPNRELWDILTTATGSRRQPLTLAITTAGYDRESICYEVHEYARKVNAGIINDPAFYGVIFAAPEGADWTKPETWRAANPGYGVSVKADYLATEAARAQNSPAYQNTFRRLHLNEWTQQDSRWLDLGAWDKCGAPIDLNLLAGATCYGGLDLASTSDLAALLLVFPNEAGENERYTWVPFFWVPGDNIQARARRDRVPYDAWARDGLIKATPGNVIDYGQIAADIEQLAGRYRIKEIAYDRWGATQLSTQLTGAGLTMVGFGQGFASMSGPTTDLMRVVLGGRLNHGNNAVLRWMADNLVVTTDPAGNVKPNKARSREKIDGIVAGIMGQARAAFYAGSRSVYETGGIKTI